MEETQSSDPFDVQTEERTVLLVDDEENILNALRRLLRRDGYRILTAPGGEAGLALLAREKVDVIVSDQRMPGMSGTEFLAKAKEVCPHSVRIVLSGYTDLKSVTDSINEGAAYKFLTKPWDDDILRLAIREAFAHKWVQDENRMLHGMLVEVNNELAEANRQLSEQTELVTDALHASQDILYHLPLPVFGLDAEGMLMTANRLAIRVLGERPTRLGAPAAESLPPELLPLGAEDGPETVSLSLGGREWIATRRLLPQGRRGVLIVLMPAGYSPP